MTFLDVGANIGQYTLLASGLVGESGHVHGFEPNARTFSVLESNLSINNLANAAITRCEVGAESVASQPVPRVSLDDYVRQRRIEHVDLIKIDIDGGELDVLRGARQLLSSAHPPQLIVEFAESNQTPLGHSCAEMADFLRGLGNELFCIDTQGPVPYVPWGPERAYFNVLVVPAAAGRTPAQSSSAAV
jgi:hypothetical protein